MLLGRRAATARFMPGRFVFPGGVLEPEDLIPSGYPEQLPKLPEGIDGSTRQELACFARTALRETYEESGLLLGAPYPRPAASKQGLWATYAERRLLPAFGALTLFAQAITPSSYPIRFHARFFLAEGQLAQGSPISHGELEAVAWVPLGQVQALPLPSVTRDVLRKALALRAMGRPGAALKRLRAWRFA